MPRLFVKKTREDAVIPTKAHESDIGYDLTLVAFEKELINVFTDSGMDPRVLMYDTGIAVMPEKGYYVEIAPRSSISKTGYILANGIGIIDPDYRGSLKVALIKVDKYAPTLPLPFKGFQLIVRKAEESSIQQVDELDETVRGDGGFGSTG